MTARDLAQLADEGLPSYLVAAWGAVTTPLLVHDEHRIVHANAAMLRLLGYETGALLAMPFEAWAVPEQREALRQYGLHAIAHETLPPAIEVEAETGSGSIRALEVTARPYVVQGRRLNVLTVQDLSDSRHVQTSLLNVGRVLHQIIENNPVASFVLDAEHRVTHWNAACSKLTGIDAFDMMGRRDA